MPNNRYFGSGSNSNGQFWFGGTNHFPGFLYKKNVGVGGRRTTNFGAGGTIVTNAETNIFNKYRPGVSGVGASTIANRRAKNRLASVCVNGDNCSNLYKNLGVHQNYANGI